MYYIIDYIENIIEKNNIEKKKESLLWRKWRCNIDLKILESEDVLEIKFETSTKIQKLLSPKQQDDTN